MQITKYKFYIGQKVLWSEGMYPYYTVKIRFEDMGCKLYSLLSPDGCECGGRVPENELRAA